MHNGTKEDVEMLKKRMEERRLRAKLEKVVPQSLLQTILQPQQMLPSLGGLASRNRFGAWLHWSSSPDK